VDIDIRYLRMNAEAFIQDCRAGLKLPYSTGLVQAYLNDRMPVAAKDAAVIDALDGIEGRLNGWKSWLYGFWDIHNLRRGRERIEACRGRLAPDYAEIPGLLDFDHQYWGVINDVQDIEHRLQFLMQGSARDPTLASRLLRRMDDLERLAGNSKI
jgi:hypothetical protein